MSVVSYSKCSKFFKLCWAIFLLSYLVYQLIIQCKRMQGPKSGSISALGQSVFLIYLDIWALRNFFNFHSISSCKKVLKLQTASGCAEFRSRLLEGEFLNPIWTKWKFHFDLSHIVGYSESLHNTDVGKIPHYRIIFSRNLCLSRHCNCIRNILFPSLYFEITLLVSNT